MKNLNEFIKTASHKEFLFFCRLLKKYKLRQEYQIISLARKTPVKIGHIQALSPSDICTTSKKVKINKVVRHHKTDKTRLRFTKDNRFDFKIKTHVFKKIEQDLKNSTKNGNELLFHKNGEICSLPAAQKILDFMMFKRAYFRPHFTRKAA